MAKLMGRNWKVQPGIWHNDGYPVPKGRAEEKRDWSEIVNEAVEDYLTKRGGFDSVVANSDPFDARNF